jgi:hypothetical protein
MATSTEQVNHLQDEITPFLVPRVIEEAGVRIVGWENSGRRAFFYKSDTAIEKPSDLSNLKMRVPPNPIMIASYKAWGGKPTPLAWKELYSALQQGVVEGGDNPVTDVIGMKFHEVINRMTKFHYTILTHPIMVSEVWYQKLSKKHQEVILRAGSEATDYIRWWQPIDEAKWWAEAEKAGVQIDLLTVQGLQSNFCSEFQIPPRLGIQPVEKIFVLNLQRFVLDIIFFRTLNFPIEKKRNKLFLTRTHPGIRVLLYSGQVRLDAGTEPSRIIVHI